MTERADLRWVDTHAHLDDRKYQADQLEVIQRAMGAGVTTIINIGADLASSRASVKLAEGSPGLYATVGVHPHDAATVDRGALDELRRLAQHPRVVAIGEIGLDYYRDLSPRPQQREAFAAQLDLAASLGKPVVIHDREAHDETVGLLNEWARGGASRAGVMHCFAGDLALARRVLDLGFYIGVDGPVTFNNARRLVELVRQLPADRLLLETDCPYLTPHPHRGRRNEPAYVPLIAQRIAEIKEVSLAWIASVTSANAARLFGLEV